MHCQKLLTLIGILFLALCHLSSSNLQEFSWQDPSTLMSSDLKSRINKGVVSKGIRKYCSCPDVGPDDMDPVCGSNGALYKSVCHFNCAQLRIPTLVEVDDGRCDSITFKEPTENKIKYQSHY